METATFYLFARNTNGKRKFVFLGHQTINGNRQQTVNCNRRLSFSKRAHLLWHETRVDMNYCEIQFLAIVNRVNLAGFRQFSVVGNHWRHFSGMVTVPTSQVPGGIYDTASKPVPRCTNCSADISRFPRCAKSPAGEGRMWVYARPDSWVGT